MRYTVYFLSIIFLSCQSGIDIPDAGTAPTADFIFQIQVNNSRTVSFASTSKDASSLVWDFGDEIGRSFVTAPTYSFARNGTYVVKLTAVNKAGINTKEVPITVEGPNDPMANFEVDFTGITNLLQVKLTNTSEFGSSYLWNFGDGQTSTQQNPGVHQYASAGIYQIELAVSNATSTVTRRKRTTLSVIDGTKIIRTWKFKTSPYRVAAYPVNGANPSQPYFVLRNGSLAYESNLLLCELNDRYSFTGTVFTTVNNSDGRVFENRNECKTIPAIQPSSFQIYRTSLSSFVVDTGATYLGDLKAGPGGFAYDIVELTDLVLVVSYQRADETNPSLLERVVMVFEAQ